MAGMDLAEAAKKLGLSETTLKLACRGLGIPRWPRGLVNSMRRLSEAITVGGAVHEWVLYS